MSYKNPTKLEETLSRKTQKIMRKLGKIIDKEVGAPGEVAFMLHMSPYSGDRDDGMLLEDLPVATYAASHDRETSAKIMVELLMKWELHGEIPPLHEIIDYQAEKVMDNPKGKPS